MMQAGQLNDAWSMLSRAYEIFQEVKHPQGEAIAANNLAFVVFLRDGPAAAIPGLEKAMPFHQEAKQPAAQGIVSNNLGFLLWTLEENERAISYLEQSIKLARQVGDVQTEGRATGNLGLPLFESGQVEQGLVHIERAIRLWASIEEKNSFFHIMRADVLHRAGRQEEAKSALREAQERTKRYGHPEHVARLGVVEGHFLRSEGATEAARVRYEETRVEAERTNVKNIAALAQRALESLSASGPLPKLA